MGSIGRYLSAVFSIFFRWWWAALTGIFTIISVVIAPQEGITLGRVCVGLLVFAGFSLVFMVISITVTSWRWYLAGGVFPKVLSVIPEKRGENALTLIVQSGPDVLSHGSYLALFRVTRHDVETCAAVLHVTGQRTDGKGLQAGLWISPIHKTALQKGEVRLEDLRLRIVSREVLSLVEKCIREEA